MEREQSAKRGTLFAGSETKRDNGAPFRAINAYRVSRVSCRGVCLKVEGARRRKRPKSRVKTRDVPSDLPMPQGTTRAQPASSSSLCLPPSPPLFLSFQRSSFPPPIRSRLSRPSFSRAARFSFPPPRTKGRRETRARIYEPGGLYKWTPLSFLGQGVARGCCRVVERRPSAARRYQAETDCTGDNRKR